MAELVDALDLGSSGVTRESSSLSFRTSLMVGKEAQPDLWIKPENQAVNVYNDKSLNFYE